MSELPTPLISDGLAEPWLVDGRVLCRHPGGGLLHYQGSNGYELTVCTGCGKERRVTGEPPPDYVGAIAAIKELHRQEHVNLPLWGDEPRCTHCYPLRWPCPTIQALGRYGCG
jgi:hypothetical protein